MVVTIKEWIDEKLYKKIESSIPIVTIDLLIIYNNTLLLLKRNNEPAKDEWFTPGGRIYLGETIDEVAQRVLKEETGLTILKIEKKGVMSHIWPNRHCITIYFRVDVENDNIIMNKEHKSFKWISNISDEIHPYVKTMIKESKIFSNLSNK